MKFLLPSSCIACNKFQASSICNKCLKLIKDKHTHRCWQCALPCQAEKLICDLCRRHPPSFDSTICLDGYGGILTEALQDYKYQGKVALATCFTDAWKSTFQNQPLFHEEINWMIPVPLSIKKLHQRGFNQSWELCKRFAKTFNKNADPYVLGRNHIEGDQAHATREERFTRLINTFRVNPKRLHHIKNQHIVIVDDVMTTGATLNIMAKLLKDFGAQSVHNWVILRTSL